MVDSIHIRLRFLNVLYVNRRVLNNICFNTFRKSLLSIPFGKHSYYLYIDHINKYHCLLSFIIHRYINIIVESN